MGDAIGGSGFGTGTARSQPWALFAVDAASGRAEPRYDDITGEEPLEIRVCASWQQGDGERGAAHSEVAEERTLSITLRTPGGDGNAPKPAEPAEPDQPDPEDRELALGYLFAEGIVSRPLDVKAVTRLDPNVIVVTLRPGLSVPWPTLERHGVTSSACGLCGKRSLEAMRSYSLGPRAPIQPPTRVTPLQPALVAGLPDQLRLAQKTFARTGGLHAAALFDWSGRLLAVREDIGRHNAVDKVIGAQLLAQPAADAPLALHDHVLVVSGRAGFELLQKARMACVPLFVAVGAPSSLAVSLAHDANMTLVAFCRDGRFNVYTAPERLNLQPAPEVVRLPT